MCNIIMQSHTETIVCGGSTAIPGDDDGGSGDDDGTESECGSDRSDYSFSSSCLEVDELAGDSIHTEHRTCGKPLPGETMVWNNTHDTWDHVHLERYDSGADAFDAGRCNLVTLRGKVVKRVADGTESAARAIHRKGRKACPCLVLIYNVPVLLVAYKKKTDTFRAVVFGVNDGRLKQSQLRLYYHAGVRAYPEEKQPSLTGSIHIDRKCRSIVGKRWTTIAQS